MIMQCAQRDLVNRQRSSEGRTRPSIDAALDADQMTTRAKHRRKAHRVVSVHAVDDRVERACMPHGPLRVGTKRAFEALNRAERGQPLPVARMTHHAYPKATHKGDLKRVQPDCATCAADQHSRARARRQLLEREPGGQRRAGQARGRGEVDVRRHEHQRTRRNWRVVREAPRRVRLV